MISLRLRKKTRSAARKAKIELNDYRPSARWLRRAPAAPWSNRRAPSAAAGANQSVGYRADLESAGQGSGGPMTSTSYSANTAFIFSALLRSASVIRDSAATHSSIRPAG